MTARSRKQTPAAREDLRRLDAQLDEALLETFPASDPIAVGRPTATERPRRSIGRKAALPAPAVKAAGPRAKRRRRAAD